MEDEGKRGPAPSGPSNYLPAALAVPIYFVMPAVDLEWAEPLAIEYGEPVPDAAFDACVLEPR